MSFNLHCLFFIPYFAVRRLSSPFLVSGGQVSPSPESPLPFPPVIYLFVTKLFGVALSSSQNDSSPLGASPLSFSPPLTSQVSFPTLPWPWLEPLGLSTGVCLHFLHFPQVLVPWLSPSPRL